MLQLQVVHRNIDLFALGLVGIQRQRAARVHVPFHRIEIIYARARLVEIGHVCLLIEVIAVLLLEVVQGSLVGFLDGIEMPNNLIALLAMVESVQRMVEDDEEETGVLFLRWRRVMRCVDAIQEALGVGGVHGG